jgi:uncharacterized protein
MLVIPPHRLAADTLTELIETFVLREGTDYGERETTLADKVNQVRMSIVAGKVLVSYDERTQQCTLLTKSEYDKYNGVKVTQ